MGRLHRVEAPGLEVFVDLAQEWVVFDELDDWENSYGVEDVFDPRGVLRALEESQGLAKCEVPHYVECCKVHHLPERYWLTGGFSQFRDEQVDVLMKQGLLLSETAVREGWGENLSHPPVISSLCREEGRGSCSRDESKWERTTEMHNLTI